VSFSFGLRPELVARARAGGARVLVQVASGHAARTAADAGADALIVQGVEAGGHVQRRRRPAPAHRRGASRRIAAAGGRRRHRRSSVGAGGGWSRAPPRSRWGTRFVASDECDAHPRYKARLLEAEGADAVLTDLFDVGWPAPHRVLRNSTYERWENRGEAAHGPSARARATEVAPGIARLRGQHAACGVEGDVEAMAMYAGQGVGTIDVVERPASDRRALRRGTSASRCATARLLISLHDHGRADPAMYAAFNARAADAALAGMTTDVDWPKRMGGRSRRGT
jgi:nitronate monooxygenase